MGVNMPDSPIIARYNELRHYLGLELLDMLELERAYMQTPRIIEEAGQLAASADKTENDAKHNLDIAKAAAGERIRSIPVAGREPSEARVTSLLPLEPDVQEARNILDQARYEAQVCESLYKALETQSRLLAKATDMVLSGYITPTAAYEDRRAEVRQARIANNIARPYQQKEPPHVGRPTR
jgi:hypothetical protein